MCVRTTHMQIPTIMGIDHALSSYYGYCCTLERITLFALKGKETKFHNIACTSLTNKPTKRKKNVISFSNK